MHFILNAYQYHVFLDFQEIQDNTWQHYAYLNEYLNGSGVPSLEEVMHQTFLRPIHQYFNELVNPAMLKKFSQLKDKQSIDVSFQNNLGKNLDHLLKEIKKFTNGSGDVEQYRCTTHNKGIMNGMDAVTIATGNDFRAVEAGAHSFAAFRKPYTSLTHYEKDQDGNLVGSIEVPLAVGTVGGATRTNPVAGVALKILGTRSAQELSQILASVGLAQNFAALRALATEGIQRGHMSLHARQVAIAAGATGDEIERVAAQLIEERSVRLDRAQEILGQRVK